MSVTKSRLPTSKIGVKTLGEENYPVRLNADGSLCCAYSLLRRCDAFPMRSHEREPRTIAHVPASAGMSRGLFCLV